MGLNLYIYELETPFRLARKGDEPSIRDDLFKPEDWAWEFLRLSPDYQNAYEAAKAGERSLNGDFAGAFEAVPTFSERIRTDEVTCRSRFGLSTWLDPRQRLPRIKGRRESWFYPLSDCKNLPEDSCFPVTLPDLFGPRPFVPFDGISRSRVEKRGDTPLLVASPCVWFAIDCSVPPAAQVATVEVISRIRRDWLHIREAEVRPNLKGEKGSPVPLVGCHWFSQHQFRVAERPAEGTDPAELWFAIRVDVSKRISDQMKHWKRELALIHDQLKTAGKVVSFIQKRLRDSFGQTDDDGSDLSDGNFLKERAICAQLSLSGLDAEGIVRYVKDHATKQGVTKVLRGSKRDTWNKALNVRVQRYADDGVRLVKGDYRWLVHAKKP